MLLLPPHHQSMLDLALLVCLWRRAAQGILSAESYFFMKSDRLSPKPEEGAEPFFWSSNACSPALRFFALFLLLALADDLLGSAVTCHGFFSPAALPSSVVCLALEIRLGPSKVSLVFLEQLPQVMTFDMPPGLARASEGSGGGAEAAEAC